MNNVTHRSQNILNQNGCGTNWKIAARFLSAKESPVYLSGQIGYRFFVLIKDTKAKFQFIGNDRSKKFLPPFCLLIAGKFTPLPSIRMLLQSSYPGEGFLLQGRYALRSLKPPALSLIAANLRENESVFVHR